MNLKINFKDFDFKQFMLRYGEWVGLGVAGIIALPVLFSGLTKAVGSGSPTANANDISKLASGVQTSIEQAIPPKDADEPPPEAYTELKKDHIDPSPYSTKVPWFVPSTIEDTKRRIPDVLFPVEFKMAVVRGDVPEIMLDQGADGNIKVYVIESKEFQPPPRLRRKRQSIGSPGAFGGAGGGKGQGGLGSLGNMGGGKLTQQSGPGAPAGPGGAPGGMGGGKGMGPSMGPGSMGMRGQQGLPSIKELVRMDVDKLDQHPDAVLAETIDPVHMVIIAGAFPIREQLEKFRKALHKRTLRDLFDMFSSDEAYFRFVDVEVERQVWKNGKVVEPWAPFTETMIQAMTELTRRASGAADEPEALQKFGEYGFLNNGLVMRRPALYRGSYPDLELQLEGIRQSLDTLSKENADPAKKELSGFTNKLTGKGINIWNVSDDPATQTNQGPNQIPSKGIPGINMGKQPPNAGGPQGRLPQGGDGLLIKKGLGVGRQTDATPMSSDTAVVVPEMALIRLIDPTVEPGKGYQYRVKVKMINPNFGKTNTVNRAVTKQEEIIAKEWTEVKGIAEVPPDVYWYAIDDRHDQDKATIQIHHWLGGLSTDPNSRASLPVANWSILEKAQAFRGEYLGPTGYVKVPVWRTEQAKYMLAKNPKNRGTSRVAVDFAVRDAANLDPALVIDFEGGKSKKLPMNGRTVVEDVPVQLLVLSSDGKLMVRSTEQDIADGEREKRVKDWKDWVSEVETGGIKTNIPVQQQLFDRRGGGPGR